MRPLSTAPADAPPRQRTILVLIVLTTALGPLALNLPLPSLPGMAAELDVSYGVVQFVLTLYLLALAAGQLVYGPLSDRFGRRPVLNVGVGIFALGSLICAVAPDVNTLLAGRFVQGFGGCAGMVIGRAMIRDLFGRDRSASLIAYVTMAMVLAPMLAPAVGGALDELIHWRAPFVLAAGLGVLLLAVTVWQLPETHFDRTVASGMISLVRSGRTLLAMPVFLAFTGIMGFTSGMFFAFLAGAPYIVVELMGRSPAEYGLWFIFNASGYMLGNFLAGRYAERFGVMTLMRFGTALNIAAVVLVVVAMAFGPFVPATLFLPMTLTAFANGFVMPTSIASAVSVRPDLAGAASGLSGALQMAIGAGATVLVAAWLSATATPMLAVIAASALLAAIAFLVARRYE